LCNLKMNFQPLSKPSRQWTFALILTATAVTGTIAFYGMSQSRQSDNSPQVAPPAPELRQITALGRLEPTTEVVRVSVPATLSNDRVAQLQIQRGDNVRAGQVIAIMDSQARLQNALLEARTQVQIAQAELAKVRAGAKTGEIAAQQAEIARLQKQLEGETNTQQAIIARWQAEVVTASADYKRYSSLYAEGAIAAAELDQKRLALETAQAQLDEVKAKQNQSVATLQEQSKQAIATLNKIAEVRPVEVQVAQANLDKAIATVKKAESDLAEATIRAPLSGRILDIYAKPGEVVGEDGIVQLGQTSQMQVVAEVYETDISKINQGQQATIASNSFSGKLRGTVNLIGLQVLQQEVTSGEPGENLDRRVIQVRIQLNRDDSKKVANFTNLQVQVAFKPKTRSKYARQTL
jgi:HlyD family secretion protein